jgi:hypothetical protein
VHLQAGATSPQPPAPTYSVADDTRDLGVGDEKSTPSPSQGEVSS